MLVFIGLGGLHRLYIGRRVTGLVQLLTLGGVLVWQLWDIHELNDNDLADAHGFPLAE
jgi:TM2 domain-containing membrane protein YozV